MWGGGSQSVVEDQELGQCCRFYTLESAEMGLHLLTCYWHQPMWLSAAVIGKEGLVILLIFLVTLCLKERMNWLLEDAI